MHICALCKLVFFPDTEMYSVLIKKCSAVCDHSGKFLLLSRDFDIEFNVYLISTLGNVVIQKYGAVAFRHFLSPRANRHAGDILFTVCLLYSHSDRHAGDILFTVGFCLCLSAGCFCKGYLWRGLTQGDDI